MKRPMAHLVPPTSRKKRQLIAAGGDAKAKGKIVIATVKATCTTSARTSSLVVLQCNNYEVVNMGVMVPAQDILKKAKEEGATSLALGPHHAEPSKRCSTSPLRCSATCIFVQRQQTLLLIGGATTSRAHTAVKIAPHYTGPVVYVPDASRAVGVYRALERRRADAYIAELRADFEAMRALHAAKKQTPLVSLADARANGAQVDFSRKAPAPKFTGRACSRTRPRRARDTSTGAPSSRPGTSPFHPAIPDDAVVGEQARQVFADAQALLKKIIDGRWLQAHAVFGFYPATRQAQTTSASATP